MVSRTITIPVAIILALTMVGVGVWRSVPDIPKIDLPQTSEPEEEFTTIESNEYDDTEIEDLNRFNEQPLTDGTFAEGITYRLILLPAFDRPILIQARLDAAGPHLKTKVLSDVGSDQNKQTRAFSVNEDRQLSQDEWNRISQLIDDARFWTATSVDRRDEPMPDGAYWSLYGNNFGVFHRIHRITPKTKTLMLFRYLFQLSDHELDYLEYLH